MRVAARTLEVFHRGQRVGVHPRRYMGAPSTARTPTTCPVLTGATPSGRRIASAEGPAESGRTPRASLPPCSPIGRIPKGFGACLGILRSYRGFGPRRRTGRLQLQGRRLVARPQVRHVRLANRRCWMARISALVERVDLVGEPGVVSYWRSDEWRPGRNGWSRKGGDVRAGLG